MNTSTIIFNVAAVVALLGAFLALADLMKNKTVSYGVTRAPSMAPTPTPSPTPDPVSPAASG